MDSLHSGYNGNTRKSFNKVKDFQIDDEFKLSVYYRIEL